MNILISACLFGVSCRYNGTGKLIPELEQLKKKYNLIPVCPEQLGGLPTPRKACEQKGDYVITKDGDDCTEAFCKGAEEVLRLAKLLDCEYAILKERSPSCGHGKVYDGTFTSTLIDGSGVTAALLSKNGIKVIGESAITSLL